MKQGLIVLALVFFICCKTEMKKKTAIAQSKIDTTITAVEIAFNISVNDYRKLTAQRITKDSTHEETVDTTERGQIIREIKSYRDSSYLVWWPVAVPDSTGKPRKNYLGTDSVIYRFVPIQRNMVIHDYNCHFH